MIIKQLIFNADDFGGGLRFGGPAACQGASPHFVVPGIAVGNGDKFHAVSLLCIQGGDTSRLHVAIIGMRAED